MGLLSTLADVIRINLESLHDVDRVASFAAS